MLSSKLSNSAPLLSANVEAVRASRTGQLFSYILFHWSYTSMQFISHVAQVIIYTRLPQSHIPIHPQFFAINISMYHSSAFIGSRLFLFSVLVFPSATNSRFIIALSPPSTCMDGLVVDSIPRRISCSYFPPTPISPRLSLLLSVLLHLQSPFSFHYVFP